MPKFVLIFYIYSSNYLPPCFWFYLRYTNKSTFGLYMLSFNLLCFISTPYNHSLPALGLTLDTNKEKYTKLSVVLFPVVLRVANFLLPYFCSVVSLLCRKPVPRILHQLCKILLLAIRWSFVVLCFVCLVLLLQLCQRFLLLWLCIKCLATFGKCCESVP